MIILAFSIENLGKCNKPKFQAFEVAIIKKSDFKSIDRKIVSGKYF